MIDGIILDSLFTIFTKVLLGYYKKDDRYFKMLQYHGIGLREK